MWRSEDSAWWLAHSFHNSLLGKHSPLGLLGQHLHSGPVLRSSCTFFQELPLWIPHPSRLYAIHSSRFIGMWSPWLCSQTLLSPSFPDNNLYALSCRMGMQIPLRSETCRGVSSPPFCVLHPQVLQPRWISRCSLRVIWGQLNLGVVCQGHQLPLFVPLFLKRDNG